MRVGVFAPAYNEGNRGVMTALGSGIPGAFVEDDRSYRDCDVMVIFGLVKRVFAKSHAKGELIRRHRGPVIVVERGYLRRDEYWSVGIGGINGRADFANRAMPPDRFDALGIELMPWHEDGDYVLVCGQVPWDVAVQDVDHIAWCRNQVKAAIALGFPVRFRPHPYAVKRGVDYGVGCEVSTASLEDDLAGARIVVTFNSNSGVDAIVAGRHVTAHDRGSMVWPLVPTFIEDALTRKTWPNREQWAANIAYAQWTLDEMREGLAWRHISKALG